MTCNHYFQWTIIGPQLYFPTLIKFLTGKFKIHLDLLIVQNSDRATMEMNINQARLDTASIHKPTISQSFYEERPVAPRPIG